MSLGGTNEKCDLHSTVVNNICNFVMSLSIINNNREGGNELIMNILNNLDTIHEEARQRKSDKRRTFGENEGAIVDKLSEICNYKCDSRNRETVNRIMTLLEYPGYIDKPRFRQRIENSLKKKRMEDKSFHPSTRKPKSKAEKKKRRSNSLEPDCGSGEGSDNGYSNSVVPYHGIDELKNSQYFEENAQGISVEVYGSPYYRHDVNPESNERFFFDTDFVNLIEQGVFPADVPVELMAICAYELNKEAGGIPEESISTMEYPEPSAEDMGGWYPSFFDDPNLK